MQPIINSANSISVECLPYVESSSNYLILFFKINKKAISKICI